MKRVILQRLCDAQNNLSTVSAEAIIQWSHCKYQMCSACRIGSGSSTYRVCNALTRQTSRENNLFQPKPWCVYVLKISRSLTHSCHIIINIIRLHQLHNEETTYPIIAWVSQAKDYCHTRLCNLHLRVCAVLATKTNVTECDSDIVSTEIWTLGLQSASHNRG